ncbi:GNAT family N-acetyltransferase [Paenibacillus amylolyticus]|nr:GNAT family N-acetyltransferase [Paenibacillus amylolyticus]
MLELEFTTIEEWDEALWARMERIYHEAFQSGAKTKTILQYAGPEDWLFTHGRASWRSGCDGCYWTGGKVADRILIIDYLAVEQKLRGWGIGTWMLEQLRAWALREHRIKGMIIEAEFGTTEAHQERIQFWQRNGFILTSYVHQYRMVPEPYQAMMLPLDTSTHVPDDGEALFPLYQCFSQGCLPEELDRIQVKRLGTWYQYRLEYLSRHLSSHFGENRCFCSSIQNLCLSIVTILFQTGCKMISS